MEKLLFDISGDGWDGRSRKAQQFRRKNQLEQFKIMRRFAQARRQQRAALCPQRRLSSLAISNFRYTWRVTHRTN